MSAAPALGRAPATFTLQAEMRSDWHVGTGYGRAGDVDRLVRRDADGLPYAPGKTVTGIWRDACEVAAQALDHGNDDHPWARWVDALFGSQHTEVSDGEHARRTPRPAALSVCNARIPGPVRSLLVGSERQRLRDALTFVKPGVKVDPRTGAAEDDHLRFEEMARSDIVLDAPCELTLAREGEEGELSEEQHGAVVALLVAGAQLAWRLGASRRRGAGRCSFRLEGWPSPEAVADWLAAHAEPPDPPPAAVHTVVSLTGDDHAPAGPADSEWLRLPVRITTRTPLIVLDEVLGNLMTSRDYLPGRYVLQLVTRALRRHGVNAAPLVAGSQVVATDATVEIGRTAGAPLPLAFQHDKLHPESLWNRLVEAAPDGPALKTATNVWVAPTAAGGALAQHVITLERTTHNAVQDEAQRPTEAVGGVYTNEAIPEGVTLVAEVRLPRAVAEALPPGWWRAMDGRQTFGRSRKDDYGLCDVVTGEGFEPAPQRAPAADDTRRLTVWALSDIVLLDRRLRPAPTLDALAAALAEALEVEVTRPDRQDETLTSQHLVRRTDTWQASWGLPRPSVIGLRAGSCALFTVDRRPDAAKIADVEAAGVGERRAEGFGQLLLDAPLLAARLQGTKGDRLTVPRPAENQPAVDATQDVEVPAWLEVVERAAWRSAIAQRAAEVGRSAQTVLGVRNEAGTSEPEASQLGGLRKTVDRLRNHQDSAAAVEWVERVLANPRRTGKWPQGALEDRVRPLLRHWPESDRQQEGRRDLVWDLLELPEDELTLPAGDRAARKAVMRQELWAEAVRALVHAALHAHQRDVERSQAERRRRQGRRQAAGQGT